MKRIFISLAILALSVAADAQTLIKANFEKGDTVIYTSNMTMNVANADVVLTTDTRYVVQEVQADGYLIESLILSLTGDTDSPVAEALQQTMGMLKGNSVIVKTDINGAPQSIVNFSEVNAKATEFLTKFVEDLYAKNSQAAAIMSKEKMLELVAAQVTEEKLLDDFDKATNLFKLYGKTLKTGDVEEEDNDGIKLQNTYQVTPLLGKLTVVVNGVSNMNPDEIKTMFFKQLEKANLPADQLEQIKGNYDMLVKMGMAKVEINNNSTYMFQKNSWLQELKATSKQTMFGQKITSSMNVSCKYSNRK